MSDAPERFSHVVMRVFADHHPDRPIPEKVAYALERIHEAEIARLREALEGLLNSLNYHPLDLEDAAARARDVHASIDIARRALEEATDE